MERHTLAASDSSDIHHLVLADPHKKFWDAVRDTAHFIFVGWPLLLALAVVVRGF